MIYARLFYITHNLISPDSLMNPIVTGVYCNLKISRRLETIVNPLINSFRHPNMTYHNTEYYLTSHRIKLLTSLSLCCVITVYPSLEHS
jgi:hypothetical protein